MAGRRPVGGRSNVTWLIRIVLIVVLVILIAVWFLRDENGEQTATPTPTAVPGLATPEEAVTP
jgi:heme/copper-type cytochrome/quinol oxidase subunit 2